MSWTFLVIRVSNETALRSGGLALWFFKIMCKRAGVYLYMVKQMRCKGLTLRNLKCRRKANPNSIFCAVHKNQSCNLEMHKPSKEDVDNCIFSLTERYKGELLGRGDYGLTYMFGNNLVVKITKLEPSWFKEACIAYDLGHLGISPKVHRIFQCGGNGFIIMEKVTTLPHLKVTCQEDASELIQASSDIVRFVIVDEDGFPAAYMDNLNNISRKNQYAFIRILETMIDNEFIHMDNHIDNWGFSNNTPLLFDFGFTQKRNKMSRRWALCFSLFQIIEHATETSMYSNEFYRVANACITDMYIWGRPESGGNIMAGLEEIKESDMNFLKRITTESLESEVESPDLKAGSLAYMKLLSQGRHKYVEDYIYRIRNPKAIASKAIIRLVQSFK
jgi:hypothetical protein